MFHKSSSDSNLCQWKEISFWHEAYALHAWQVKEVAQSCSLISPAIPTQIGKKRLATGSQVADNDEWDFGICESF